MKPNRPTTRGIGFLLADISRLLRRDFDRRVRSLEMTQAQWRALAHLSRNEGINQVTLADRLEVKPITIARLIDRMEAAGWVRREADAADRRASLLYLTPKTKPILDELESHAGEAMEMLMEGIDADDRHRLVATLEQMKANLTHADAAADADRSKGMTRHG